MPLMDDATQRRRLAELAAMWPETTRKAKFGPGVLVGNWLEDQFRYSRAPPDVQHRESVYAAAYQNECPPVDRRNLHDLNMRSLLNIGAGAEMLFSHHGELCENMATTTDLVYNHFPAMGPPPRPKNRFPRFVVQHPAHSLLDNYGNVTRYGLVDAKRSSWADEERMRHSNLTETEEKFVPPPLEALTPVRVARPRDMSSSFVENNERLANLPLRGHPLRLVPERPYQLARRKC